MAERALRDANHLIEVLERFNGSPFVTVDDLGVTTGTGLRLLATSGAGGGGANDVQWLKAA
jgi:hypothetical protein